MGLKVKRRVVYTIRQDVGDALVDHAGGGGVGIEVVAHAGPDFRRCPTHDPKPAPLRVRLLGRRAGSKREERE